MTVLSTVVLEFDVTRVDGRVYVELGGVGLIPRSGGVSGAVYAEGKDDRVSVRDRVISYTAQGKSQSISVPVLATVELPICFRFCWSVDDSRSSNPVQPSPPVTLVFHVNFLGSILMGIIPSR